jgi:hypothetical protein
MSLEEEVELLAFLDKNNDLFAWLTSALTGVSRDIIEHKLQVNLAAKSRKQKLHKMSEEKVVAMKSEVQRLLDACFIREVTYPQWLANVVMVRKKNGKWIICTDICHTRFLDQNRILIACVPRNNIFHTYGHKCLQ